MQNNEYDCIKVSDIPGKTPGRVHNYTFARIKGRKWRRIKARKPVLQLHCAWDDNDKLLRVYKQQVAWLLVQP